MFIQHVLISSLMDMFILASCSLIACFAETKNHHSSLLCIAETFTTFLLFSPSLLLFSYSIYSQHLNFTTIERSQKPPTVATWPFDTAVCHLSPVTTANEACSWSLLITLIRDLKILHWRSSFHDSFSPCTPQTNPFITPSDWVHKFNPECK